jgi:hypothetical protein
MSFLTFGGTRLSMSEIHMYVPGNSENDPRGNCERSAVGRPPSSVLIITDTDTNHGQRTRAHGQHPINDWRERRW